MIYPLLSQEHENHLMLVPSITTLTFYKLREGESAEEEEEEEDLGLDKDHCQDLLDNLTGFPNHIANHLSTKCSEILAANPWLSGRIVRNGLDKKQQQQQLVLVVEDCEEEEGQHLLKKHLSFVSRSLAGFSSSSPYHIANERAQSLFPDALVPPARHLIDDPHHRPLFKITAIHLREANEILLITSLCHAVADGFTFYAINSMLDKNGEVYPMDPVRRPELEVQYRQQFPDMVPRVISRFPARFIFSTLVNIVQYFFNRYIFNIPTYTLYDINLDLVAQQKKKHNNSGFVSTNDIITSYFLKSQACDFGCLVMNFRGRMKGCTTRLAGNYTAGVHYNKGDYESPAQIRESITPVSSSGGDQSILYRQNTVMIP